MSSRQDARERTDFQILVSQEVRRNFSGTVATRHDQERVPVWLEIDFRLPRVEERLTFLTEDRGCAVLASRKLQDPCLGLQICLRAGDAKLVGPWRWTLAVGPPRSGKGLNPVRRTRGSLTQRCLGISDRVPVGIVNTYRKSG